MLTRIAALIVTAGWLLSCGSNGSRLAFEEDKSLERKYPVFVVMGGYQSCGDTRDKERKNSAHPTPQTMRLYRPFQNLLTSVEHDTDVAPLYITSCFNNKGAKVFYTTSTAPDAVLQAEPLQFYKAVEAMVLEQSGSPRLTLIGHSHGGWLAMKLAQQLSLNVGIDRVETLDPISYVNCNSSNIIQWRTRNANPQCLLAPEDIRAADRQKIHDRVLDWHNGFQDQSSYLHSSEISQAHHNYKTEFRLTSAFGMNAHTDYADDAKIWEGLTRRVRTDLQQYAP